MLSTLRIKNLALVEDLTLELRPGYNVITGETGAGKSMLIGALSLVLGERADRDLLRGGSDICMVEAVFEVGRLKPVLAEVLAGNGLEPCEGDQLMLKRSFTSAGTNRQFVNGSPTTLSVLFDIGQWLVDIHGPHDHQSLLQPARQLAILDSFGKLEEPRAAFTSLVRRRSELEARKAELIVDEKTYLQRLELLRFQSEEIAGARLEPGEEAQVEQEHRRAANAARVLQLSQAALDLLGESEGCLLTQAGSLGRTLQEVQKLDPAAAGVLELQGQALSALQELQSAISRYAERIEVDPSRLLQLDERLNLLQALKRKYGPTLQEVIAHGHEARRKLASLEQREAELAALNDHLRVLDAELLSAGQALSARRRKLIPTLSKAVSRQLADLGFRQSRFEIGLSTVDHSAPAPARYPAQGLDSVEFLFAPNPGEPIRPLRAIASSGEMARVMLALKTVLAAEDAVPVLVFDEVDANLGGETAHAVGDKMRQIAQNRQVLCITHLPQVAAPASAHFLVSKEVRAGRTLSQISLLEPKQRVVELARMLGGNTEAARKHAQALLVG